MRPRPPAPRAWRWISSRTPFLSQYLLHPEDKSSAKTFAKATGSGVLLTKAPRRLPAKPATTSLERVLAVLRHQEPDRVPHFEWVPGVQCDPGDDPRRRLFRLDRPVRHRRGDDRARVPQESLADGIFVDEGDAVRRIGQDNYAMPVDDQAPIKSLKDLKSWQPPDPDDPFRYEKIQATIDRFGGRRAIILQMRDVWSGPRDYIGYTQLFINLKECPELVDGVVRKCVNHYIRVIERASKMGVTLVFSGDDVADNRGPMLNPDLWQSLFIPHFKRLVTAIHGCGLYHWKHSDGNMYPLLDSIVNAGSDGIDPIDPMGGMELKVVKAKYGDRVAIKGNVDQTELLMYGPPEAVVELVKSCIRDLAKAAATSARPATRSTQA